MDSRLCSIKGSRQVIKKEKSAKFSIDVIPMGRRKKNEKEKNAEQCSETEKYSKIFCEIIARVSVKTLKFSNIFSK